MRSHGSIRAEPSSSQHPGATTSYDDASTPVADHDDTASLPKGGHLGHPPRPPLPTELLQEILLYLDFRTLTQCQRVSRFWDAAIARSPRLQQALFLSGSVADARSGSALVFKIVVDTRILRTDQPHPQPIFWIDLSKHFTHAFYPHREQGSLDPATTVFNPILHDMFGATHLLDPGGSGHRATDPLKIRFHGPDDAHSFHATTPGLTPSWRHMFISQPPVQTITMECDFTFDPWYRCKSWTPYNVEGGIRMEGLLLLVQSLVESSFDDYLRDERCRLGVNYTYHGAPDQSAWQGTDTDAPLPVDDPGAALRERLAAELVR